MNRWGVLIGVMAGASFACHGASTNDEPAAAGGFDRQCADLGLTRPECDFWVGMVLPDALPESRGNRFGDDLNAARLGFDLFFDLGALSQHSGKAVRCADCHTPERAFANNVPLPVGVDLVARNALPLTNAARAYPYFWDGRADSLWSQPLLAIENEDEMNGTRLAVAHTMAGSYRARYEKVFGPLPDLSDAARFPAEGKPGSPAWDAMTPADRDTINQIYVNAGKALAAYVRKIATGRSAVDRFIAGDPNALSPSARVGMRVFTRVGCLNCHSGRNFSDGLYHHLDPPPPAYAPYRAKTENDRGRSRGLEMLVGSEFNSLSRYYDRAPSEAVRMEEDTQPVPDGFFRTPSLRNVGDTAPYGHTGVFDGLEDVVTFHLNGGGPTCRELRPHTVSAAELTGLIEFLNALHGDTAPLPWSFWPPLGDAGVYPDGG